MKEFLATKLYIAKDGILHVNEVIGFALLIVLAVLMIILIKGLIVIASNKKSERKRTIFKHRKNQYKSRIGKKDKY